MKKKELELLEKVFEAEIEGAVTGGLGIYQTKAKLAQEMAQDGYLHVTETVLGGRFPVRIKGYILTELGRIVYCSSCA